MEPTANSQTPPEQVSPQTKFCKYCGKSIDMDAVLCIHCGKQVETLKSETPQVVIHNTNTNKVVAPTLGRNARNKWVALVLCIFLGWLGAHKFYEGKAGMGVLYFFTLGLFGIGWIVDGITIAMRPNPYYV